MVDGVIKGQPMRCRPGCGCSASYSATRDRFEGGLPCKGLAHSCNEHREFNAVAAAKVSSITSSNQLQMIRGQRASTALSKLLLAMLKLKAILLHKLSKSGVERICCALVNKCTGLCGPVLWNFVYPNRITR